MEVSLDVGSIPTNSTKILKYMNKLSWDSVTLVNRIRFLKTLALNSTKGTFNSNDMCVIDALITGSMNNYSGDMKFNIEPHHMVYLQSAWNLAVSNQKNNVVLDSIKTFLGHTK